MELRKTIQKLSEILKKYRYVILIVVIGLVLMAVPSKIAVTSPQNEISSGTDETSGERSLEERLSSFLSLIKGAGECRVILTEAAGEEVIYQTNEDTNSSDTTTNVHLDVVTVTGADRAETGLVKQINPQIFQGAVIICSGADDPAIRLSIVDAVSKLTGLGANQISVLKMK